MSTISVGIVGGSGYAGLELLRILLGHPRVSIEKVSSRQHVGKRITELHRSLAGLSSLEFVDFDGKDFAALDAVFLAVPHTESMALVKTIRALSKETTIVDLGADFRLPQELYETVYATPHTASAELEDAVYGAPELFRQTIPGAKLIANPGCFAYCSILALTPLMREALIEPEINISAITGSSGSGSSAKQGTHHPERNESIVAYNILGHRHAPEIAHVLTLATGREATIQPVPQSGPFSRGIFATIFAKLKEGAAGNVDDAYRAFAAENRFVRLVSPSPRLIEVRGSNFCDIAVAKKEQQVVVISALDNLVKGASGTAVQNMNLSFGFPEELGLMTPPLLP